LREYIGLCVKITNPIHPFFNASLEVVGIKQRRPHPVLIVKIPDQRSVEVHVSDTELGLSNFVPTVGDRLPLFSIPNLFKLIDYIDDIAYPKQKSNLNKQQKKVLVCSGRGEAQKIGSRNSQTYRKTIIRGSKSGGHK
jgi:hypothetical protein